MNVALVMAPFELAKSFGLSRKMSRGTIQPLGIGYLAAELEARGHRVHFLDAPIMGWDVEETVGHTAAASPGLIGVSCYTFGRFLAFELAARLRQACPGVPIVMGGPHATTYGLKLFDECGDFDYAFIGEAEYGLADLAETLEQQAEIGPIAGLMYRDDTGETVMAGPPRVEKDIDVFRHPVRHIYEPGVYNPLPIMVSCPQMPAETMITSRGCPWARCAFCYEGSKYAAPYRRRSPANVLEELRPLAERGARYINFQDDNFCFNEKWIEEFCQGLVASGWNLTWSAFGRVDTVSPAMLENMAAAGCVNLFYGFESGNQESLDLINKGTTLEQIRQAVRWTHAAGIEIRGSIMLGLPGETPEMGERTIRFACELNTAYMLFQPYHCLPGTPLECSAHELGHFVEHDNVSAQLPSYVPEGYESPEQLAALVKSAYRRYYLRPSYIGRALWRARKPRTFIDYVQKFMMALETMGLR